MHVKGLDWCLVHNAAATTAKSLQSCPTLCDPIHGSPPGSSVPGILQARTLEWVAISFSNAWKWEVKVKSLSRVWLFSTHGLQPTRLLHPWDFPGKSTGVGCHRLLRLVHNKHSVNGGCYSFSEVDTLYRIGWVTPPSQIFKWLGINIRLVFWNFSFTVST